MKNIDTRKGIRHDELDNNIRVLAHMEPTDSLVVSCYLDISRGLSQARQHLLSRKTEIAACLSPAEQHDFTQALDEILAWLEQSNVDCRGLALFSRPLEGGNYFRVLEINAPVRNKVSVMNVPDIVPLMLLRHEHGQYLQASVSDEAIVVYETGLNILSLRGMAPIPMNSSDESKLAVAAQLLERTMRGKAQHVVVINGDLSAIHGIYRILPKLLRRRVIQLLPRKTGDSEQKILNIGRLTHKRHREYMSRLQFNEAVKSDKSLERLVTGTKTTHQALRSSEVSELFLSADDLNVNTNDVWTSPRHEELLDVVRMAVQKEVPIRFTGSSRMMSQAKGVSCLLTQAAENRLAGGKTVNASVIGMVA